MPNLAGPGPVNTYAAKSHQTDFSNYHNYGLQEHWARVRRLKHHTTKSVAEMIVLFVRKSHSLKIFGSSPGADDDGMLEVTGTMVMHKKKKLPQRFEFVISGWSNALA